MKKPYVYPNILLDSDIAKQIIKLEPLRSKHLESDTPPWIFFGLKNLFQTIESVVSTQIEGNKTTIADFVEAARSGDEEARRKESVRMILNIEKGVQKIETADMSKLQIDKDFILDLHRTVVDGLDPSPGKEGDDRPGAYRNAPRKIQNSKHVLPHPADIRELMDELINFINAPTVHQMDLVKIAMAHHRFVWIHPFGNGNGRVVRLLTYAMLAKAGYVDKDGARLFDPTAVFGNNKLVYYDRLAGADDLSEMGTLNWVEYMLSGLVGEVEKIDRLLDKDFAKTEIILPAIEYALNKQRISKLEYDMLVVCVEKNVVAASDFAHLFPADVSHVNISQTIKKLRNQNLIEPLYPNARKYILSMNRNPITFGILGRLDYHGFLPPMEGIIS